MQHLLSGRATPQGARPTVEAQRVRCRRTGARTALRASMLDNLGTSDPSVQAPRTISQLSRTGSHGTYEWRVAHGTCGSTKGNPMSSKLELSKEFVGRRALVTGGSRGIGATIARRLLDAGAK